MCGGGWRWVCFLWVLGEGRRVGGRGEECGCLMMGRRSRRMSGGKGEL